MKKIFNYIGIILSVALMGAVTACNPAEILDPADIGLGIKVFAPTKVVAGQPMTINGSGFSDAKEIVFPDGVSVTDFEIVSNDMIRVIAPSGISATGGKIKVVTSDDAVESKEDLTLGKTVVSGFSKQEGEAAQGGELITIFGQDLEFINGVEMLDVDGNPYILEDKDFYRKGTSTTIFAVPRDNIFTGKFVGRVFTYDGREFAMPELAYEPAPKGAGHWETVKTVIWKNGGSDAVSWSGTYRFALEGHDGNNECIAEIPQDLWDKLKTETFYLTVKAEDPQVRVTTGWWDPNWKVGDIQPGNELMTDNGDGTWTITINLADDPDFVAALDERHLLFTGDRFTPVEFYFAEDIWIEGGGHKEIVRNSVWKNSGSDAVSWSGTYRFALEGHDGNNECIAEIPQDIWDKLKTETFYIDVKAEDPQVRVTTGWWDPNWKVGDIQPGNELMTDNGDGTWTITINLADDPDFVAALDERHLLFTGDRFTPIEIYFTEEIWVDGDEGHWERKSLWKNDGSGGSISWNGTYRFANEETKTGEEIFAFDMDTWALIKEGVVRVAVDINESSNIRITTGWWTGAYGGNEHNCLDMVQEEEDGTKYIELNIKEEGSLYENIDVQHLLFTGDQYMITEIYVNEWVEGGGGGSKDVVFWENAGSDAVSWSGTYRFALEGHDGNNECIAQFPQDVWDKMKSTAFYLDVKADDPQVRVTTGWWDANLYGDDIQPGNDLITDNGNGTWTVKVVLADNPDLVANMDEKHVLFTGDRYTPIKLYFK